MCDYLRHAALRGYAIGLNAGSYLVQTASDGGAKEYMGFEPWHLAKTNVKDIT